MSEFDSVRPNSFSCPACGGRMIFSPADQQLKCPYCGSLKAFRVNRETPYAYDIRFEPPLEDAAWSDALRVIRCGGCEARFILTGETAMKACPFCGSASISVVSEQAGAAPDSLISFQLTRGQAAERFRKWLKKRHFAPSSLHRAAAKEDIAGFYLPQWAYDDDATSDYEGRSGRHEELKIPVTVTDPDGKQRQEQRSHTRTRWQPVSGTISDHVDGAMIHGSDRLLDSQLGEAGTYQLHRLVPYTPEYVAGFVCEKPDVDVQEGWRKAQILVDRQMAAQAERVIRADADEAEVRQVVTQHDRVRYRLVLLPMYICAYRHRNKVRHVFINGQNGRVNGDVPVSIWRMAALILGILAILAVTCLIFLRNGGSDYMFYDFG